MPYDTDAGNQDYSGRDAAVANSGRDAAVANSGDDPSMPNMPAPTPTSLSPTQIYLLGSLDSEARSPRALAALESPTRYVAVPPDARLAVLTPTSQMLYIGQITGANMAVTATALFLFGGEKTVEGRQPLPTPKCDSVPMPNANNLLPGPGNVRVHPDTGEILYSCQPCPDDDLFAALSLECVSGPWWDPNGGDVFAGANGDITYPEILATGYNQMLLVGDVATRQFTKVYDRTTKQAIAVTWPADLPRNQNPSTQRIIAARAVADGFRIALRITEPEYSIQRFHIARDGMVTTEGTYAELPADVDDGVVFNAETTMNSAVLDDQGNLIRVAWSRTNFDRTADVVVKRPVTPDTSVKLYDESKSPWSKTGVAGTGWVYGVPSAQLVTGP